MQEAQAIVARIGLQKKLRQSGCEIKRASKSRIRMQGRECYYKLFLRIRIRNTRRKCGYVCEHTKRDNARTASGKNDVVRRPVSLSIISVVVHSSARGTRILFLKAKFGSAQSLSVGRRRAGPAAMGGPESTGSNADGWEGSIESWPEFKSIDLT